MEKYRILCFGDSLTWGYDPVSRTRFKEEERWTGILQNLLGNHYQIIEEGQNGRTIATEDPAEGEKNGLRYIIPCLESQSPLNLMILMLGANDLKRKFSYCSMDIAGEMQIFLEKVQSHNRFHMNGKLKILLLSPPVIGTNSPDSWLADSFDFPNAAKVSSQLASWYQQLAKLYDCAFLDTSQIVSVSPADGVHLDADSQKQLAHAIFRTLRQEALIPDSWPES